VGARTKWLIAAATAVAVLAAAPSAAAVVRHASPTGAAAVSDCTSPDPANVNGPCTLRRAIEQAVTPDEVIVAPGDYVESTQLTIGPSKSINLHGADGQPMPRIITSAQSGLVINSPGTTVRRLRIEHSGTFRAFQNFQSLMAEQIIAHTTGGFAACDSGEEETLRDTVCWNTATNGSGLFVSAVFGGPFVANVRNVTTVATGTGSFGMTVRSPNMDVEQTLVAKNTIADGVAADVHSVAGGTGSKAEAILSNSNYATELEEPSAGTAPITDPGTGVGNQTASPLFTDAAMGLFHQAVGSPTIDAGAAFDLIGSADIDADPRTVGAAPDIGADEFFVPSPPTPPPSSTPVATTPAATAAPRICKGKTATIVGTDGSDKLSGTPAADVIAALAGNDKVSGLAGNDTICGGAGNDRLKGGQGKDTLLGQKGKDTLKGGPGKDTLKGGPGKDKQVQ
jgi:RTX calcium-binding nonapeptide repeat (4 copies)